LLDGLSDGAKKAAWPRMRLALAISASALAVLLGGNCTDLSGTASGAFCFGIRTSRRPFALALNGTSGDRARLNEATSRAFHEWCFRPF